MKKYRELVLADITCFIFIVITLLLQFGIHIKVDAKTEIMVTDIGYTQSSRRVAGKNVAVSNCKVKLNLVGTDDAVWLDKDIVFPDKDISSIEEMIEEKVRITRNVFWNAESDKIIGITQNGNSRLALYYYNSKMFKYGILIIVLVNVFGILFINRSKIKSLAISKKGEEAKLK